MCHNIFTDQLPRNKDHSSHLGKSSVTPKRWFLTWPGTKGKVTLKEWAQALHCSPSPLEAPGWYSRPSKNSAHRLTWLVRIIWLFISLPCTLQVGSKGSEKKSHCSKSQTQFVAVQWKYPIVIHSLIHSVIPAKPYPDKWSRETHMK